MGGEHSGHYGHAGRPGSVGGSAPSGQSFTICANLMKNATGYGYFDKWRRDLSKEFMLELGQKIPDSHVESLDKISFGSDEILRDGGQAYYDPNTQQIRSITDAPQTIAHEIGHHVAHKVVGLGKVERLTKSDWSKLKGMSNEETVVMGIRRKEIIGDPYPSEFFAESYSLWARGYSEPNTKLRGERTFGITMDNYRNAFPETANLLDSLFGG